MCKAGIRTIQDIISKIEILVEFPEIGSLLVPRIRQKSKYRYLV
jgi:toxin ParE1/3/4